MRENDPNDSNEFNVVVDIRKLSRDVGEISDMIEGMFNGERINKSNLKNLQREVAAINTKLVFTHVNQIKRKRVLELEEEITLGITVKEAWDNLMTTLRNYGC